MFGRKGKIVCGGMVGSFFSLFLVVFGRRERVCFFGEVVFVFRIWKIRSNEIVNILFLVSCE